MFVNGMKRRSFPFGEREGDWGRVNKEQTVQECDATMMNKEQMFVTK